MSRDYKTHTNSSISAKSRSTLLLGVFIGYALGLLSAIGTWMYINQAPSPFISQDKVVDSAATQTERAAQSSGTGAKPANVADAKPRFEFYKILPDAEEPVPEHQIKQAAQRTSSQDKYFLQAGSFQNADDADNLKAKLAMLGVEASVQAANLPEKGTWHRVRVGPFSSAADGDRVRASLQQSGVQSSLIKIHEGVQ
ncbi:SPOR domain-containing protein [Nitrosospira sp. Nsp1]|uniref:SPOR domain-containing protein n=1 Tax=Nitrosospira sp. Nsp1 TaxID=136547 RepID=UPI0008822304|nr:SPOR domain-containing protein [Nitrosospira sp. Nsp1]SCX53536.1 Sporulation related domain-containing protein [Nitrosospira sp. Nsp1]